MKLRLIATMALAAVVAALAVGCGDDDETTASSTSTGTETTADASGGETVAVSETEYAIDPADPTVKAGTVTFEVTNDGEITHNLEIEGPSGEQELEPDLAPGDSGTLEVDLSEPGSYEWYCPIGDHRDQGMEGEITVE